MHKRLRAISVLLGAAIICAGPAAARSQSPVPAHPSIEDPAGDANYLNDQGQPNAPDFGDNVTGQDLSGAGDILHVWFTHTARSVELHIQTEAPPPESTGLYYAVDVSPGEGSAGSSATGCLRWIVLVAGDEQGQQTTWQGPAQAKLLDYCNDGDVYGTDGVWGELRRIETLEDGSGLITVVAPRRFSPLLKGCATLSSPQAVTKDLIGQDDAVSLGWTTAGTIDTTKVGADYKLTGGGC